MTASPIDSASPSLAAASDKPSTAPSIGLSSPASPATPATRFTTIDELFNKISQTVGDILTVYGVSAEKFNEIVKEQEKPGRQLIRLRRFLANSKILIITIPTTLHEKLHTWIYAEIDHAIDRMGLSRNWNTMGSTTHRAKGHPNGDGGEGDSTGGPKPKRRFKGSWPTLVIEAGDSQTLEGLRNDMRWWFSTSDHQVKIVLLAKFDHNQNQIILEKWIEVQAPTRTGATTTRAAARAAAQGVPQLVPDCNQVITIIRNPGVTDTDPHRFLPSSYTVTRGDLQLEFSRLFLREAEQGEGDIIISIEELQVYAGDVWQVQEEEELGGEEGGEEED